MSKLNQEYFGKDNFTSRRTTGHNLYDPESLITGEESERGLTYQNSERSFASVSTELSAYSGELTTDEILVYGPRRLKTGNYSGD